jgi:hypothetical protein
LATIDDLVGQSFADLRGVAHGQGGDDRGHLLRANYGSNPWQEIEQCITSVSWVSRIKDAKESLMRSRWEQPWWIVGKAVHQELSNDREVDDQTIMIVTTFAMSADQIPLFEENYFRRTHASVVGQPDLALTELVANCWDAGACLVEITIPENRGELLEISDDGIGMTELEFNKRWRTLSYNRLTHQGPGVEFPPGVTRQPRSPWMMRDLRWPRSKRAAS